VAQSKIPTISGVGHETDVTICDLVADLRAPTPTAAAELVAAGHAELLEKWTSLERHLRANITDRVMRARQKLDRLYTLNRLLRFSDKLDHERTKLLHQRQSMLQHVMQLMQKANHQWQQNHQKLLALSPNNVLKRGFSILINSREQVIRNAGDVQPGEQLEALLSSGKLTLKVIACNSDTSIQKVKDKNP
jgi:exodeoxyribonuclease VII large subunit